MKSYSVVCSIALFVILTMDSCGSPREIRIVDAVAPAYPRIAQSAHIEGDVVVAADIGPDGKVLRAEVVSGLALREIRQASLDAARKWVFSRSSRGERRELLTFEFRMTGEPNKDGQETQFSPPHHVIVTVHPVETDDPVEVIHGKRK